MADGTAGAGSAISQPPGVLSSESTDPRSWCYPARVESASGITVYLLPTVNSATGSVRLGRSSSGFDYCLIPEGGESAIGTGG